MSLFAFLGGRFNMRAWGQALFAAGCRLPSKPDKSRYIRATDQLIRNDCKIILDCAKVICTTRNSNVLSRQKMIMFSRLSHLDHLKPYADRKQRQLIQKAKAASVKARKVK